MVVGISQQAAVAALAAALVGAKAPVREPAVKASLAARLRGSQQAPAMALVAVVEPLL
jgi:hypothetical protein